MGPVCRQVGGGFGQLLDYVERHGDARVPKSYTVDGYKLGHWVTTQRSFRAKGVLEADRERRLQDLSGWTWDTRATGGRRVSADSCAMSNTTVMPVPQSYTVDDYKLGHWVNKQRSNYAKSALDADRERRLQDLTGWTWKACRRPRPGGLAGRSSSTMTRRQDPLPDERRWRNSMPTGSIRNRRSRAWCGTSSLRRQQRSDQLGDSGAGSVPGPSARRWITTTRWSQP